MSKKQDLSLQLDKIIIKTDWGCYEGEQSVELYYGDDWVDDINWSDEISIGTIIQMVSDWLYRKRTNSNE